jgi:hypothetical protein
MCDPGATGPEPLERIRCKNARVNDKLEAATK